jgi:hypothetical protein
MARFLLIVRNGNRYSIDEIEKLTQAHANDVGHGDAVAFKFMSDKFWKLDMCGDRLKWVPLDRAHPAVPVRPEEKA